MNACNLHLYLVLDAAACGERLLAVAEAALQGGVSVLQLRGHKTAWSKRVWYDTALAVKARCAAHQVPFIINDQVDIALAVGADGGGLAGEQAALFVPHGVVVFGGLGTCSDVHIVSGGKGDVCILTCNIRRSCA